MEPVMETPSVQDGGTKIAILGLAGLYCLLCLCIGMGMAAFVFRQQIPVIQNYFPTAMPNRQQPAAGDEVFRDDFSDSSQNWHSKWDDGDVVVKDGQLFLFLSSSATDSIAMSQCDTCPFLDNNFYIEADLSTDQAINVSYGIAFNIKKDYDDFYLFEIDPQEGSYFLYKTTYFPSKNIYGWMLRTSRKSNLINPYPQPNKLGIYFDKDLIELFINGIKVDSYQDTGTGFKYGDFGFFIGSTGFKLIVDNLFVYSK